MGYKSQQTITRPANTTAYAAGDVLGATAAAISFIGLPAGPTRASGGDLFITSVDLRIHVSAIPAGMTSFRLHLYDATPPSALADNAAWDLPSGDRANYIGYIDLGTPADVGSTLYCRADAVNAQIRVGSTGVFGYLVTNGGFTPAGNSEVYVLTLHAVDAD